MKYIVRYLWIMYNRKVYRKSREFMIERQCVAFEQKWSQQ